MAGPAGLQSVGPAFAEPMVLRGVAASRGGVRLAPQAAGAGGIQRRTTKDPRRVAFSKGNGSFAALRIWENILPDSAGHLGPQDDSSLLARLRLSTE